MPSHQRCLPDPDSNLSSARALPVFCQAYDRDPGDCNQDCTNITRGLQGDHVFEVSSPYSRLAYVYVIRRSQVRLSFGTCARGSGRSPH